MHIQGQAVLTTVPELLEFIKNEREQSVKEILKEVGEEKPLTPKQAIEFLQIDDSTFYRYLNRSENPIPHLGTGRFKRFEKRELRIWLANLKDA